MMSTIEEMNASWEPWFLAEADTADIWVRMKAKGAVAGWHAPIVLQPGVSITATENGREREVGADEFYTFVVSLDKEELTRYERGQMTPEITVILGILEAAKVMQLRGIDVGFDL